MVSIRLQRRGRRGHAQFRMVVQDSRRSPTSGRVIANLGFYNPHTKEHGIDLQKASFYLANGAQPSARVVKFLAAHKVELPTWVQQPPTKKRSIKDPQKLRRNRPEEATPQAAPSEETPPAEEAAEPVDNQESGNSESVDDESHENDEAGSQVTDQSQATPKQDLDNKK